MLLFVNKNADDITADQVVNDLDKPEKLVTDGPCMADPTKCVFTVTGTVTGASALDGSTVHLYSGAEHERYKLRSTTLANGSYAFENVFPGVYAVKIDQDRLTQPCAIVQLVRVGVNDAGTGWNLDAAKTVTVPAIDGAGACWIPPSNR